MCAGEKLDFGRIWARLSLGQCVTFFIETVCWQSWSDCSFLGRATGDEADLSFVLRHFSCHVYCSINALYFWKVNAPYGVPFQEHFLQAWKVCDWFWFYCRLQVLTATEQQQTKEKVSISSSIPWFNTVSWFNQSRQLSTTQPLTRHHLSPPLLG